MRGSILVALLFVAGCVGNERLDVADPEISACRTWLETNLDEPEWDEVEWVKGDPDHYGKIICTMKVRTIVPGGKKLVSFQFFIDGEGEVFHVRDSRYR